jgi:glyoxylase-like metal-dependent hydrolase (beta-lactamase superfamily II)
MANREVQAAHDAFLAEHFPDVDLRGGRYTPQDVSFSGSLSFHQGEREVRVLELGVGHSESDVVVHLPAEKIVFCGDVFLNGMPQLPGRGHVTQTIAHYRAIEALEAEIYVAGHGDPGTLADVRAQRTRMEADFERVKAGFERGLGYDEALEAFAGSGAPSDSQRMMVLYSYCELAGTLPESAEPARQNHFILLQGIAAEARLLLGRKG